MFFFLLLLKNKSNRCIKTLLDQTLQTVVVFYDRYTPKTNYAFVNFDTTITNYRPFCLNQRFLVNRIEKTKRHSYSTNAHQTRETIMIGAGSRISLVKNSRSLEIIEQTQPWL